MGENNLYDGQSDLEIGIKLAELSMLHVQNCINDIHVDNGDQNDLLAALVMGCVVDMTITEIYEKLIQEEPAFTNEIVAPIAVPESQVAPADDDGLDEEGGNVDSLYA